MREFPPFGKPHRTCAGTCDSQRKTCEVDDKYANNQPLLYFNYFEGLSDEAPMGRAIAYSHCHPERAFALSMVEGEGSLDICKIIGILQQKNASK